MAFLIAAFVLLFRTPIWLSAPEHFCSGRRLSAPICTGVSPAGDSAQEEMKPVFVVGHGWHTGLMLRFQDIPPERWQESIPRTGLQAVEIGWGDEGFYRAKKYTAALAANAFFLPTPSVIHAVLLTKSAEENFLYSDVSVFYADQAGYQRLLDFVDATFAKDPQGKLINLGPGIYGQSTFFRAVGSYHFPKSCNAWVAEALRHAGAPVWPWAALTAQSMLRQTSMVGEVLRSVPGWKLLPN